VVRLLVAKGAVGDVIATDDRGHTALHIAADRFSSSFEAQIPIVDVLLGLGASSEGFYAAGPDPPMAISPGCLVHRTMERHLLRAISWHRRWRLTRWRRSLAESRQAESE